jgi:hypothetical protein
LRSHEGRHVAIQTEDGDYAVAHLVTAELRINDEVTGDLINPGRSVLRRRSAPPVPIFLEGCRLDEKSAKDWIESLNAPTH